MKSNPVLAGLLILVAGYFSAAFAQGLLSGAEWDEPLEISSHQLEVFQEQQTSVFSGEVVARQAQMTLWADRLTIVFTAENEIRSIEAAGAVRIEDPLRTARAATAVFDRQADTLVLSGDAEVTQGENRISGDEIILYLGENRSTVRSSETGRVRALILPDEKVETP
ncbi:MAG: lipopolysaccharide transport periplasmic protein LptA [Pelovirga sp.]